MTCMDSPIKPSESHTKEKLDAELHQSFCIIISHVRLCVLTTNSSVISNVFFVNKVPI